MKLCMAKLLVVSNFRYLQNSASNGAKTWFLGEKSLYFQTCLLSFEDIENPRQPKVAPCNAARLTYRGQDSLGNLGRLNQGILSGNPRTERADSSSSLTSYTSNCPKAEPLPTLVSSIVGTLLLLIFLLEDCWLSPVGVQVRQKNNLP